MVRGRRTAGGTADPQGAISVTLVLDGGALIALERNERSMWARLKAAEVAHELP